MASQGPLYPSTMTSDAAVAPEDDDAWVNPTNVGSDNAAEAQITAASFDSPDISRRLSTSGYGFTIPAGSTIDGIVVEIERRSIIANSGVDNRVQLRDASGALVGANKATATVWPTSATIATYGGAADTWTASPTPTMVNDPDFGVVLSAKANIANADIGVDFIRVTVHYTPPADTALAGSSAGASTAAAGLTTGITLGGSSPAVGAGSAALTTQVALGGSSAGIAEASGALTSSADTALAGSAAGTSVAGASLTSAIALAGSATAASTASASVTTQVALSGLSAGASSGAAALTSQVALAGVADASSSASGLLSSGPVLFEGASAGSSSSSASLSTAIALVAGAAGSSSALAALATGLALAGISVGASGAAGTFGWDGDGEDWTDDYVLGQVNDVEHGLRPREHLHRPLERCIVCGDAHP